MKKTLLCWLAALGAAAVIPACGGAAGDKSLSGLDRERFRSEVNGRPTDLYTLTNAAGMEVCITNFGGRIVSVMVPDRTGTLRDVVLGFDNIADYVRIPSDFGASIGRYANRIGHGRFVLDGDTVRLPVNNYGHCLHGGPDGWQYRVYEAHQPDPQSLALTLHSPDGDAGFPGAVTAKVVYRLTEDNAIDITYEATADRPTVVNLTNHSYFNLSGDPTHPILDNLLTIAADGYTPVDSTFLTLGRIDSVGGTPFDFRRPKAIGAEIDSDDEQLRNGHGGRSVASGRTARLARVGYRIGGLHRRTGHPGLCRQLPRRDCPRETRHSLCTPYGRLPRNAALSRFTQQTAVAVGGAASGRDLPQSLHLSFLGRQVGLFR